MLAYRFCSWKIKKGGLTAIFAGKNPTCRPKRPVSCVSSLREMQLLDVAPQIVLHMRTWFLNLLVSPLRNCHCHSCILSYLILSYHPRHLQIPVESRSPPSNLRCALQRHQGYRRIHPGQYGHLSEMMGGWMEIAIYISTYNKHIYIHMWVYLLRWICGEII